MQKDIAKGFRVSPQQRRLWSLQREDQNLPYRTQGAVMIEGELDHDILFTALKRIVSRHEIFRTTFPCDQGTDTPVQLINQHNELFVNEYDLRGYSTEAQTARIESLLDETLREPPDPERYSSLCVSLTVLSPQRRALIVSLPAMCADGLALENLVREISISYAACLKREDSLEETLQYADIAEWLNELLESGETEAGREYWSQFDLSRLHTSRLPFEGTPVENCCFTPRSLSLQSDPRTAAQVEELAVRLDLTSDVVLQACWQALLWRLSGQADFVVGTLFDHRKYEQLNDSQGLFARYLPVHAQLHARLTFIELITQVAAQRRDAFTWQEYFTWPPATELPGDTPRSDFFPISFEYLREGSTYSSAGLTFYLTRHYSCLEPFTIKLSCVRRAAMLDTEFHYDSARFSAADLKRVGGQFHTLLVNALANPEAALSELEILSAGERKQLLCEFNDTASDYPREACLHQLFEEQVARTPDNVAAVFEDESVTYIELNRRANRLARHLREQGVGPEVLVAICMERSLEVVVGLLGILKAGAAYVPLDPAYPRERLAYMLRDAGVSVMLIQQRFLGQLPDHTARVVCIDRDGEDIAQQGTENFSVGVRAGNCAYVIYTSGSTGEPKGVQVTHRAVVNFLCSMQQRPGISSDDALLAVTTLSFDIAALELFLPLSMGARIHIAPREVVSDAKRLRELLDRSGATMVQATPVTWRMLNGAKAGSNAGGLRILCGGEALSGELAQQLVRRSDEVWNLYGPTESTIWSAIYRLRGDEQGPVLPIGRAIANTQIYVLDEWLRLMPVGVPGEIYIGGEGLARGYLGQFGLTAERFVPDAFGMGAGERLYKTGDLGSYNPDGNLEYLGRIDQQVKVRGTRIEPGEIEAALLKLAEVREAVVVARDDLRGEKRLIGYVVTEAGHAPPTYSVLRQQLAELLPEYMIPAVIVQLKQMPLTANGKVDRRALPASDHSRPSLSESYQAARTPAEEMLVGIWSEVLGVERVGVADNFFELGGHSLLATQLVSRVREAFGVEAELRKLFEQPTVAALAAHLEELRSEGNLYSAPPIKLVSREENLPLSFAQQRLWFIDQLGTSSAAYNVPAAVRLTGHLDVLSLTHTFTTVTGRHESLRTTFSMVDGHPVQVIRPPQNVLLPLIDLSGLSNEHREVETYRLVLEEAGRHFNLERGPLFRATLLHLGAEEHVVMLTLHHIISDGWSMGVLVREIATTYEAYSQNLPSPLAELPIQYADYAHWQRQWLQGDLLESQLSFWRHLLSNSPPSLDLPSDRVRPPVQTFRGALSPINLSSELSGALKKLGHKEGVTLFMTLLASFQLLLSRWSGQTDIVVGSPIANRHHAATEGLIGFLVNTLALRTDLSGDPSFSELLHRVRETALSAYAHQDVPFEMLVEELRPIRDMSRNPFFQVMLVLQNADATAIEPQRLKLEPIKVDSGVARFDLLLHLTDTGQELGGALEYNTDLFDGATIARLVAHFQTLLEGVVANPERRISQLSLLSESERLHLLEDFNPAPSPAPFGARQPHSLQSLFEQQVEQWPNNIALVCGAVRLSYRELNDRANQLAHRLMSAGAGPETLIGICTDRSVEMAVAVLAVIKAGAAYLPLDPAYPAARLQYMLDDAGPLLVVTQAGMLERLPGSLPAVICVDLEAKEIGTYPRTNPESRSSAAQLLYVIYTSGSTGRPKGVSVPQGVMSNLVAWHLEEMVRGVEMLQFASLSFDASIHELLAGWCGGSRLHLVSEEMRRDTRQLAGYILEAGIEKMILPVVVLQQLAEHWEREGTGQGKIKEITTTGEQMQLTRAVVEVMERWEKQAREGGGERCEVYNHYGPSETHVVTSYRLGGEVGEWERRPPIGKPIANTAVYILDQRLELVPEGVRGELYLGGAGVGRGYVNRAAETAERYVPDPYRAESGARMYRTGDVGRYREGGVIEYVGRGDEQVKVRGHRVELGEVEAALSGVKGVAESVVVMEEGAGAERRMVGYVVGEAGVELRLREVREELGRELPEYMIPAVIVQLPELPLTANGKVDKRALPAPDQSRPELEVSFVAPRTPAEEVVAGIWAQVLRVEQVGVHDNFFELGGNSLLTTQVVSRLHDVFRVEVPLRSLFQTPTIEGLVDVLAQMWGERELVEEIARTFKEVAKLSDDQLKSLLVEQGVPGDLESSQFPIRR
jgi:amino acid adenylation domain-containing protein